MGHTQGDEVMVATLESELWIEGIDKPASALALGTASFRLADAQQCFELLDDFRQMGGTVVDSGRQYGESEAVIGEWLETRRAHEQMVLVTKCAHGANAILPSDDFEDAVTRELEQSLQHLRTETIDLYMLHRDNHVVPVGRIVERLNQEVARGRVRALGASNWTYERVDQANDYALRSGLQGFSVVSNNLSLAVPAEAFYPRLISTDRAGERWHETTRIPLLSWSSQARGFFTGRYTQAIERSVQGRAAVDHDPFTRRMVEVYGTRDNLVRLRRAEALGAELGGYSAVQVSLAWLLHKPFPVVPVVGPRTRDELASCVDATAIRLTEAQCDWLSWKPGEEVE
jgi:aryl-alcohol dehydrogenase-like predicted oxidoreductase